MTHWKAAALSFLFAVFLHAMPAMAIAPLDEGPQTPIVIEDDQAEGGVPTVFALPEEKTQEPAQEETVRPAESGRQPSDGFTMDKKEPETDKPSGEEADTPSPARPAAD